MPRIIKPHSRKAGLPPGSLVYLGDHREGPASISVLDYSADSFVEKDLPAPQASRPFINSKSVTWINVVGLHDMDVLKSFGDLYGIHPLVLEDIANTGQRPKMEDHGDYIFFSLKMLYRHAEGHIVAEQIGLLAGRDYVLSFQEMAGDVFDVIRDRIRTAGGRIRKMGADYLAYALLDVIVDNYFVVLEEMGDGIEVVQDTVMKKSAPQTLQDIHKLKGDLVFLRKNLWPLRELVSALERTESELVREDLKPYLRDLYEHSVQVIDTVETLRDMLSGALEIYMTVVSNRMNAVMKVLTVIATIFIPLTFLAGVYGMNFEHMPELAWPWGYAGVWGVMIVLAGGMLIFFKRRDWL